uniref:Putative secreted protein n=1 Tax=Amblyomma parvum TaxID=251391 RepID=A0A023G229_AMBPA
MLYGLQCTMPDFVLFCGCVHALVTLRYGKPFVFLYNAPAGAYQPKTSCKSNSAEGLRVEIQSSSGWLILPLKCMFAS